MADIYEWLASQPKEAFPRSGAIDFAQRVDSVRKYLTDEVYKHIGGLSANSAGYLTDHGPEHVATVLRRVLELAPPTSDYALTPYEAYLVTMAALLHDAGNIFGRSGHEQRVGDIFSALGPTIGNDAAERRMIIKIARAHGGYTANGSEDTLGVLAPSERLLNEDVRPQRLAALLRFADELADDSSRATRFALQVGAIPEVSRLYHTYANALQSVTVHLGARTVELRFDVDRDTALASYPGKEGERTFLLDEIVRRALKMHVERVYCMRFLAPFPRLDAVAVEVTIFPGPDYPDPLHVVKFRLEDRGYPTLTAADKQTLCRDLEVDGAALAELLSPTPPAPPGDRSGPARAPDIDARAGSTDRGGTPEPAGQV